MSIGGVVKTVKIVAQDKVKYISSVDGVSACVELYEGEQWEELKFVEGTVSFSEPHNETPSGIIYNPTVKGSISPVTKENNASLLKRQHGKYVAVIQLKNGGTLIVGDKHNPCKITSPYDISPDFSKSTYTVEIYCKSPHPCYFL